MMFQREGFGKMKKTLNGKWQFRKVGDKLYKEATVPGCNYLDLMANRDIPDHLSALMKRMYTGSAKQIGNTKRLLK